MRFTLGEHELDMPATDFNPSSNGRDGTRSSLVICAAARNLCMSTTIRGLNPVMGSSA